MGKNTYNDRAKRPPAFLKKQILVYLPGYGSTKPIEDFTSYMFVLTYGENDLNFQFIVSYVMSSLLSFSNSSSTKARERDGTQIFLISG